LEKNAPAERTGEKQEAKDRTGWSVIITGNSRRLEEDVCSRTITTSASTLI